MNGWYRVLYALTAPLFTLLLPIRVVGRERIPAGAALVCGNHSSALDPFFLAFAFRLNAPVHFMAKAELRRIPIVGWLLRKIGVFFIRRGQSDLAAVKQAMLLLKGGEKVMIFPEGTRVREDQASDAKSGVAMLALRTDVPVLPVYIAPRKRLFRPTLVHIGEAYYPVPPEGGRPAQEQYRAVAAELMERIWLLGGGCAAREEAGRRSDEERDG